MVINNFKSPLLYVIFVFIFLNAIFVCGTQCETCHKERAENVFGKYDLEYSNKKRKK